MQPTSRTHRRRATPDPGVDRVRKASSPDINAQLDNQARERVKQYQGRSAQELSARIAELEREWDIERVLIVNASSLSLVALLLAERNRRWRLLPAVVASFLLLHGIQGWCPPVPLLRRLGVRTSKEIEAERNALKALRGDFAEQRTLNVQHRGERKNAEARKNT